MKSIICYSLYAQNNNKRTKTNKTKQSLSSFPYAKLKDHLRDKGHFDEDLLEALVA